MASMADDIVIRPVCLQDAEALWAIARQEGVIETTLALPSLRLEQRMQSLRDLSGIGTRLLQTLLDLADHWLLLRRVELTVLTENEGARRLYERLGFVVEGCRKMSVISRGEIKDEWLMARYR